MPDSVSDSEDGSTPGAETWRPIRGYEGWYSVSDLGRVRSEKRTVICADGDFLPVRGRIMRQTSHPKHGYLQLTLGKNGKQRTHQVHLLVLEAFVGPRPAGTQACHGPGGRLDNRLVNLRWDSPTENSLDQVRDGTHPFASRVCCPREHLLVMPNLVGSLWRKKQYRDCLACNRARTFANNRKRRTGEVVDWVALSHVYYADIMGIGEVAA